jgi:hypothetical protein
VLHCEQGYAAGRIASGFFPVYMPREMPGFALQCKEFGWRKLFLPFVVSARDKRCSFPGGGRWEANVCDIWEEWKYWPCKSDVAQHKHVCHYVKTNIVFNKNGKIAFHLLFL